MGVKNSVGATVGDVVDSLDRMEVSQYVSFLVEYSRGVSEFHSVNTNRREILQVSFIKGSSHVIRNQPLHQEGNTENVQALLHEGIDRVGIGPGVISFLLESVSFPTHL